MAVAASAHAQSLTPLQQAISSSVAADKSINVVPFEYDPDGTNLVRATWLTGSGCGPVADPLCTATDPKDKKVEGLLLAKSATTPTNAAAGATLNGVKGMVVTELGYDIRKPADSADSRGSHCGAGAPRFNIVIAGVTYFLGCNSPATVPVVLGSGWIRLQWGGSVLSPLMAFGPTGLGPLPQQPVDAIYILFDEGEDAGPDNFGAAFLDNINVNHQYTGRGPGSGN